MDLDTRQLPRWWPRRLFYGWAIVAVLCVSETVSYGILSYSFTVFITPMGDDLGWSKAQITGAFSVASLVAGLSAIPVGRWVDRHGARWLMVGGSVLATALVIGWSRVHSLAAFYALAAMMGVAMAAVFYEPAFAVVATWFRKRRDHALTVLTFVGGLASVVFVPLAAWLVEVHGWRTALASLAVVYGAMTVIPLGVVLRRRPEDVGAFPDGDRDAPRETASAPGSGVHGLAATRAIRSASFVWLAVAFTASALTTSTVAVHLVPLLVERGYDPTAAAAAGGALGLVALAGRVIFTPLGGSRWRPAVTASIFVLQAAAIGSLLAASGTASVWAFVALFGLGLGAITPARAALVADFYGHERFGRINGVLAFVTSTVRAAAPVGASAVYVLGRRVGRGSSGYDAVLLVLLILCGVSAAAVVTAGGAGRGIER